MKKRVLIVATVPSMIGQFNMSNIHILLDMGYDVDVAADFQDRSVWPTERVKKFRDELDQLGIKIVQLDFSRNLLKLKHHLKSYGEMIKIIKKRNYAFIHTHTPIASAIARLAAYKTGTKIVYTAHGFHFFKGSPLRNWIIFYPIEKWLSKYTDVLITINKEDYKRAVGKFKAKKTIYIPGVGIDTDRFAKCKVDRHNKRHELGVKDDDFVLLSVGELSKRKNQKIVFEALNVLKEKGKIGDIIYLVVGKGELETEFEKLICNYRIENHAKLLGFRTDIDELCVIADCFVHPSIREGLGIAPLEAMAAGLPLIATSVNGIKDYTEDGISGCCISPDSLEEMVNAIYKMKTDIEFRKKCGANNEILAKTFDIKNTNNIMMKVYKEL